MINLKTIALLCMATLAGCATPYDPVQVRSGIGADVDLDALRPPSGVTYNYVLESEGVPVPVTMSLKSRRLGRTNYTYDGQMTMVLPEAENLEEIAKVLSGVLGQTDIRVRGNRLMIPVGIKSDNRFRSASSNIIGDVTRYTPHDCFAVLGECRYTSTDRNGRSINLLSTTTEDKGVWRSKTILDPKAKNPKIPNETRSSVYSIDKNAVLIDMYIFRKSGANRTVFAIKRR
ncbi:hypothetical protein [uncultured Litoreibacter sp.]|uniref:hypothetical protein n=1 Tax=uncultured Litoreibacter sp. TaxID=1392394 RepID=UPI0026340493|nr:hypothetical protein [uncultured Litoreibacter sp.]